MTKKERLSVSVDAEVAAAARRAVERGEAKSVSDWVSAALRTKAVDEQALAECRRKAFEEFLAEYEAEKGVITQDEMDAAEREMEARAIVVGGRKRTSA